MSINYVAYGRSTQAKIEWQKLVVQEYIQLYMGMTVICHLERKR